MSDKGGELTAAGGLADHDRLVAVGRGEPPAIGSPSHTAQGTRERPLSGNGTLGTDVPDLDRLIRPARGETFAVRAPGYCIHTIGVAPQDR